MTAEQAFWEATYVAVARALSVTPGKHRRGDGERCDTPGDVAAVAGEFADAALVEWRKRWGEAA